MTQIKLCGMVTEEDIKAANEINPDFVGFVFWENSHRNISFVQAKILRQLLNKNIKTVGVFVDADVDFIKNLYNQGIIDVAQLHGNEGKNYISNLKKHRIPTIKAYKITDEKSLREAEESIADYILLDAGMGQGISFDWNLLKSFSRPYFLAGGLNVDNVRDAIDLVHPFAVDVSSGIETDKKKDINKMIRFVEIVRKEQVC